VRGRLPIKQSVRAKSTSWSVAVEWREASTKDAGWREEDMYERAAEGRAVWRGRHGLIFGTQRDGKPGWWALVVVAKKPSGVLR